MSTSFQSFIIMVLVAGMSGCGGTNTDTHGNTATEENSTHQSASEPEHTVLTIKKQDFATVIRTSGRIMVDSKDVSILTAKSSGIIKFIDHYLFPGVRITSGQRLFTISGEKLAEGNTDLRIRQLKSDLDQASANYERAKSLISDKIITQEKFLEIKTNYEKVLAEFENLGGTSVIAGNYVASPASGFIREVFVTEGQMVSAGQPLASVVTEHSMILKADVSPEYLNLVPSIESAKFTTGYNKNIFRTGEMNGKRISYGKNIGPDSYYVPVYFKFDYNPELIDGTFADVYLTGAQRRNVIAVPNTSLMEEFGKFYVFVEDEDGDFLKRYIKTGETDGEYTEVREGLSENETIVATGAYNIKLSQMSSGAPAHTHNH